MQKNTNLQGFTLIELSVVLIISGLLLVGAISAYEIYDEKQKIERMNNLMTNVDQALQDYSQAEGRLPYPAPMDGSAAGSDFDAEDPTASNGILRRVGTAGRNVLIGKLPTATLQIPNYNMKDIFGNYLIYAVTENAVTGAGSPTGGVSVLDEYLDDNGVIQTTPYTEVMYTIVSMGKTGAGAYAYDGTQPVACTAGQKDTDNCDGNASFHSSVLHSDGVAGNDFYDDWVAFKGFVGGSAGDTDTLVAAKEGDGFRYLRRDNNGTDVEFLSDAYVHNEWDISLANEGGTSRGSQFFEVEAGEIARSSGAPSNNVSLSDVDGNSIDIDTRLVEDEFIFATNPGVPLTNGYSSSAELSGGSEGTAGRAVKNFRIYQQK